MVDRFNRNEVDAKDREQLVKNLLDFIDTVNDVMDLADVIHLFEQWDQPNGRSILENQTHIDQCPACRQAYTTLVRGTSLAYTPVVYEGHTTVTARKPKGRRYANRRIIN